MVARVAVHLEEQSQIPRPPRATIKALPSQPNPARPYGSSGFSNLCGEKRLIS